MEQEPRGDEQLTEELFSTKVEATNQPTQDEQQASEWLSGLVIRDFGEIPPELKYAARNVGWNGPALDQQTRR